MKAIRFYLDEAADRGIVKNDAELARMVGVTRQSVSDWRRGTTAPAEDAAARLADLLGKPEILAECMAARTKSPEARATWERAAKALSMAASFSAAVGVALLMTPLPAKAAPLLVSDLLTICVMLSWARVAYQSSQAPRGHFA